MPDMETKGLEREQKIMESESRRDAAPFTNLSSSCRDLKFSTATYVLGKRHAHVGHHTYDWVTAIFYQNK
jgi:hypothetical protein